MHYFLQKNPRLSALSIAPKTYLLGVLLLLGLLFSGCGRDTIEGKKQNPTNNNASTGSWKAGEDSDVTPNKPLKPLRSMRVRPETFSIPVGSVREFRVIGVLEGGLEVDVTEDSSFTLEGTQFAALDGASVKALSPGEATITATYGTWTAKSVVTVEDTFPEFITITPREAEMRLGEQLQFSVTGQYADGSERALTREVTWSVAQEDVARASNKPTSEGEVEAIGAGKTQVIATLGELKAEATLNVIQAADLLGIVADPPYVKMIEGSSKRVKVWGIYTDGTKLDLTTRSTAEIKDQRVLTQRADLAFEATSPGRSEVTFTYESYSTQATFEIIKDTLTKLVLFPPSLEMVPGGVAQITATGVLEDGTTLDVTDALEWSSSDEIIAGVSSKGEVRANQGGTATIESTWKGRIKAQARVNVTTSPLSKLTIEPPELTLAPNVSRQLVAVAYHADGTRSDVSKAVSWVQSNPAVGRLGENGMFVARDDGVTVVEASYNGEQARATLIVTDAKLSRLEITPGEVTLGPGQQARFEVRGIWEDGTQLDLTENASWSSGDESVAVVQNSDLAGIVSSLALGGTEITARFGAQRVSAQVLVTDERLRQIIIDPPTLVMPKGTSFPLEARGDYGRGENQERRITAQVNWASSAPEVLYVQNDPGFEGRLRALTQGEATITASLDGVRATLRVEVKDLELTSIEVTPALASINEGDTGQYNATGVFSDGTSVYVTREALWETTDEEVAVALNAPDREGEVVAIRSGKTTVRASYMGITGSTEVTVRERTIDQLVLLPREQILPVGETRQMNARSIFVDGTSRNVTGYASWSINDQEIATVDDFGVVTAKAIGQTTITVTYGNKTATAQLRVSDVSLDRIEISPANVEINEGGLLKFWATAIYSDGSLKDVSEIAQWGSSEPSVMSVTQNQLFYPGIGQAHKQGETIISAQFLGITGSTKAYVTSAKVLEVKVTPIDITVSPGTEMRFFAQAIFDDGTSRDVTFVSAWKTLEGDVLDVREGWKDRGKVKARRTGVGVVRVKYQNVEGTAQVTVTESKITQVQVIPFRTNVNQGDEIRFFATAIFNDGTVQQITDKALWTVSDNRMADISNAMWREGLVTTKEAGELTVYANYQGVLGKAVLTITGLQIQSIQVTPFIQTIPTGYYLRMQATAIYNNGMARDITGLAAWTSTAPKVADVFASFWVRGIAQGLSAGQAYIQATYQGVSGQAKLDVTSATLQSIEMTPTQDTIKVGETTEFEAEGTFSDGSTWEVTHYVTWSSSDNSVSDVSNAWLTRGEAAGFKPGQVKIKASQAGVFAEADLVIVP